jgi:serine/threonine protein kinase
MTEHSAKPVQLDSYFYNLLRVIQGGFGRVSLLRRPEGAQTSTIYGRYRAAKTFEGQDQTAVVQELSNWILLHHPAITPLIKISRLNFRVAALMEMQPGTLADVLAKRSLTWAETRTVLLQICSALQYAHDKHDLSHFDIKPANILVVKFPSIVQVSDWGISRLVVRGRTAGAGAGTIVYLAPERLRDQPVAGQAVDIFAVGMLAVHCLCGTYPFDIEPDVERFGPVEKQVATQLSRHIYITRVEGMIKDFPGHVRRLILSCLRPDPNQRQSNFGALIRDLQRAA